MAYKVCKNRKGGAQQLLPPIRARINLRIDFTSPLVAVDIIEEFGKKTGLLLNISKSQFMWIGEKRDSEETICGYAPVEQLKILGVIFLVPCGIAPTITGNL